MKVKMARNRCGAIGQLQRGDEDGPIVWIKSILLMTDDGGRGLMIEIDMNLQDRLPVASLAKEHRGIVLFKRKGVEISGEFDVRDGEFQFVPDGDAEHPRRNLKPIPVRKLIDQSSRTGELLMIKPEFVAE